MAYKHLKISVAAFERADGSGNIIMQPPFWETIEGSAEYYFLVCPLQDLISCGKGTEANPTVTEFKRIWTTMTKARTSTLVPSLIKCGLHVDGLPCLEESRFIGDMCNKALENMIQSSDFTSEYSIRQEIKD
jgi:hypothetical protein